VPQAPLPSRTHAGGHRMGAAVPRSYTCCDLAQPRREGCTPLHPNGLPQGHIHCTGSACQDVHGLRTVIARWCASSCEQLLLLGAVGGQRLPLVSPTSAARVTDVSLVFGCQVQIN
jgi:hypothetical protein